MRHENDEMEVAFGTFSSGILRIPFLSMFLGGRVRKLRSWQGKQRLVVVGWGKKANTVAPVRWAAGVGLPFLRLEDGFLRSFGTGERFPSLSMVVDHDGIYYDASCVSSLELLIENGFDGSNANHGNAAEIRRHLIALQLSKYNHADEVALHCIGGGRRRVLLVDQTAGDMSVLSGGASEETFLRMLESARRENPDAIIYVKTHPEVTSGRKRGYLSATQDDATTVVLRKAMNPVALIKQMDQVYVVTSQMGFEALMVGKPVTCFGMPWYAGWGVTDDRQSCARRTRKRTVDELFAAAYLHYTRYLDPITHQRGAIDDVIEWLARQKAMAARYSGRMICVGFRRWKAANISGLLSLFPEKVVFVRDADAARAMTPEGQDCLVHWGREAPVGLADLAAECGVRLLRMEDGFVRSVGLGSDLIRPMSLVLDARGIYFDPSRESDLEHLLNTRNFDDDDRRRAHQVRDFIVEYGITKYNIEPRETPQWSSGGREVVLVPGQVEDDASIRFGCVDVRTNMGLLKAARSAHPEAYIVYKPHPDVASSNRKGRVALAAAREFADHVETAVSIVSCIEACDVVHTMTSLSGFDALLRGKRVVVYGRPFYAGWGLTEDVVTVERRNRRLSLDELIAGALLHYPLYWDWELKGYTTCEAVLRRIIEERDALQRSGRLDRLRVGYVRRQVRKLGVLLRTWHIRK